MFKPQTKIIWICSIWLFACSSPNNNLAFWKKDKNYSWDSYWANQSIEKESFAFSPNFLLVHTKVLDYPFVDWVLPYYEVYRPSTEVQRNAVKLGACLADLSYLAIYEKNIGLSYYRNYWDSLSASLFKGYELPEFRYSRSLRWDSLQVEIACQLGSLELLCQTLEIQQPIKDWVYFGAWLESMFIVAHVASFKEEPALFLVLEKHKNYLQPYSQFLGQKPSTQLLGKEVEHISGLLAVTQTVNVWDSVTNEFHLKTFPLKDPVIHLQKTLSELREKWILQN